MGRGEDKLSNVKRPTKSGEAEGCKGILVIHTQNCFRKVIVMVNKNNLSIVDIEHSFKKKYR